MTEPEPLRVLHCAAGNLYGGVETFLSHLDAQRSYYAAQRSLVAVELVAAVNRVTLYRTLGGDATLETVQR
jgi:multidrug efflux system outer membrane protein